MEYFAHQLVSSVITDIVRAHTECLARAIITFFYITPRRNGDIWAARPADLAVVGARGDNDVSAGALDDIYSALCIEYGEIELVYDTYLASSFRSRADRSYDFFRRRWIA